jgi:hypothetical protein
MNSTEENFIMFYMEQIWEEMRHLENLRERVSALIITLSIAISGFIIQQKFALETKPLVWFLIALGMFGLIMTRKMFQIHQRGQKRLDKWYIYLENNCGENPQILKLRDQADKENRLKFNYIATVPHNYFWSTIYLFIIIGGIYFLFQSPTKEYKEKDASSITTVVIKTESKIDTLYSDTLKLKK